MSTMSGMGSMGMGMGMQGRWGGSMMFPNSVCSMYAGSVAGSKLGAGAHSCESTGQTGGQPHGRSGPRPRTWTAPMGLPLEGPRCPPPPPLSWKAGARAA
ncbi:hypothetical protein AcV7_005476 [Taiwanofungus camphoratus]|nr:hypothetical protein AcV7_005476 [Antrodia cinnamomea]